MLGSSQGSRAVSVEDGAGSVAMCGAGATEGGAGEEGEVERAQRGPAADNGDGGLREEGGVGWEEPVGGVEGGMGTEEVDMGPDGQGQGDGGGVATGEGSGGAAGGAEWQGSGDGRGRKRRRDASGQEREVRVAGLGHVVVQASAGEPLRLRDVVGGRCWKAARVPHFVHAHGNDSTDFAGLGGGSADAGGGLEEAGERDVEAERIDREALEARLGRGGYAVGAMWDEGNMVHAIRKFGGTTMGWRFGDG